MDIGAPGGGNRNDRARWFHPRERRGPNSRRLGNARRRAPDPRSGYRRGDVRARLGVEPVRPAKRLRRRAIACARSRHGALRPSHGGRGDGGLPERAAPVRHRHARRAPDPRCRLGRGGGSPRHSPRLFWCEHGGCRRAGCGRLSRARNPCRGLARREARSGREHTRAGDGAHAPDRAGPTMPCCLNRAAFELTYRSTSTSCRAGHLFEEPGRSARSPIRRRHGSAAIRSRDARQDVPRSPPCRTGARATSAPYAGRST